MKYFLHVEPATDDHPLARTVVGGQQVSNNIQRLGDVRASLSGVGNRVTMGEIGLAVMAGCEPATPILVNLAPLKKLSDDTPVIVAVQFRPDPGENIDVDAMAARVGKSVDHSQDHLWE